MQKEIDNMLVGLVSVLRKIMWWVHDVGGVGGVGGLVWGVWRTRCMGNYPCVQASRVM